MYEDLDKVAISVRSHKLLKQLLKENPRLEEIMRQSKNEIEALIGVRNWVLGELQSSPAAMKFYKGEETGHKAFKSLTWRDYAAIRLLDYIDNAGREFIDLNLRGSVAISNPIKQIWLAYTNGTGGAKPFFFNDMLHLFRQFSGKSKQKMPTKEKIKKWMNRYPSGLDSRIMRLRQENQERIVNIIIDKVDSGEIADSHFTFEPGMSREQKFLRVLEW